MSPDEIEATINLRTVAHRTTGVLHPHPIYFPHSASIDLRLAVAVCITAMKKFASTCSSNRVL